MNISAFLQSNLELVYFVYGLSFFALGIVLFLQARTPVKLQPFAYLWFLVGFAVSHGLAEWSDMFAILQVKTGGDFVFAWRFAALLFTALSFTFLMQFSIGLLLSPRGLAHRLLVLPVVILSIWCVATILIAGSFGGFGSTAWLSYSQALIRYSLGFPGSLLAAAALWKARAYFIGNSKRMDLYLRGASLTWVLYGILTGIIVLPANFFPANFLNYDTFLATFGFPVQIARTLCALVISFFLSEIYVVETTRAQRTALDLLSSLNEGLRAVTSELDLEATLNLIVGNARRLLNTDVSFLSTFFPETESLAMVASSGVKTEALRQLRLSIGQGLAGKAIRENRPVTTEDYMHDSSLTQPVREIIDLEGIVSGIAVPLTLSGELLGVLYVFNRMRTYFGTGDLDILASFAGQASVAIAHSRLFEQTQQERRLLSLVIETLPAGLVFVEAGGKRVIANEAATEYLGQVEGNIYAIPGPAFEAFRAGGERFKSEELPLARTLLRGELCSAEEVIVRGPDGKTAHLLVDCTAVFDPEGKIMGAVTAFVDITRLKELERLREEFMSVVAHDLRSPIAIIDGFASLLQRMPAEQHGTVREQRAIANIMASAKRLNRMVSDLLDAGRIEAERLSLKKKEIDLLALIKEIVDRTGEITRGHHVSLKAKSAIPRIWADSERIEQVIINLLSNAAKYSYADSPIDLIISRTADEVKVSIANQGKGVLAAEKARLFTRFYRASGAEKGKIAGLGLGLYISRGLIEAHGGRIWVESEPGQTTAFTFTLPLGGNHSPIVNAEKGSET